MSRFAKYLGFMKVKVDEEEIEIKPTLRHKQKLLGIQQKAKQGLSEEDWNKQHQVFKDILKTAGGEWADAEEEEIDAFLIKHDMTFMMALYVGFGWATEEDISRLKEELIGERMK